MEKWFEYIGKMIHRKKGFNKILKNLNIGEIRVQVQLKIKSSKLKMLSNK